MYDVIIIGTGAMGSAAAYHCSEAGLKVLAFDRFTPPHPWGSSHGQTRIIREAYFEDPMYVPIIQRAYVNWEKLAKDSSMALYLPTGGLMIGKEDSQIVKGALRSAHIHKLPFLLMSATETMQRFPVLRISGDMVAVWEPRAGVLFPEDCIRAHIRLASRMGADFKFDSNVLAWHKSGNGYCVQTSDGDYYSEKLLFTSGAWLNQLLPDPRVELTIERQVLYWFEAREHAEYFKPSQFPVFIWAYEGDHVFYGFPDMGSGIKVARHYDGEITDAERIDRGVREAEIVFMRRLLSQYIPAAEGKLKETTVCMYSNTEDRHFKIYPYPGNEGVWVASICSGHGFKFASAMGEILGDLVMGRRPLFDLSLFDPGIRASAS